MAVVAVYDACVLHPAPLRDLLIRLDRAGLVRARWTEEILDECFRSILRRRPELEAPLRRTRELMVAAVPDCMVSGYEELVNGLTLPDPDDRHVLAAAIHGDAEVIVTSNLADFPDDALARHEIVARAPDDFVLDLMATAPGTVAAVVAHQAADLRSPPRTVQELLDTLAKCCLPKAVEKLRPPCGS